MAEPEKLTAYYLSPDGYVLRRTAAGAGIHTVMEHPTMDAAELCAKLNAAYAHGAATVTAERDKARADYQFMVDRAANEKLDGYRELGARAAQAENERDAARLELEAANGTIAQLNAALTPAREQIVKLQDEVRSLEQRLTLALQQIEALTGDELQ